MTIYKLLVSPWDKPYIVSSNQKKENFDYLSVGDKVILRSPLGIDLAKVINAKKIDESTQLLEESKDVFILRKANKDDCQKYSRLNQPAKVKEAITICSKIVKKRGLPMCIMNVNFSFDGGRMTFLFTAPNRIDFRELVQELSQTFHKSIRLHQVGVRQALEFSGDIGPCGRPLCCRNFLRELGKVTTDLITDQNLSHRGAERLTGVCGRLKCCLLFEEDNYKKKSIKEKLPRLHK